MVALFLDPDISAPHFDLPFRINNNGVVAVEQDTSEDVANCVEAIVRYTQGFIDEDPDFGIPDLAFETMPILNANDLLSIISEQEPRATLEIVEDIDLQNILSDKIRIEIT